MSLRAKRSNLKIKYKIDNNSRDWKVESAKQDILKKIEAVDLLIIDDVGTERNSPTDMALMFEVFNKRDVSGKPLIITTNLKLDEFTKNSNQDYRRAYERILSKTTNVLSDMPNMRLSLAEDAKEQFNKFLKGE